MTGIPLYQTIVNALKAKISSGELKSGDQLPTEAELSSQYNVSRITSKRALSELENERLIYRVQGKGSFVSAAEQGSWRPGPADSGADSLLLILPFTHHSSLGDYEQGINEYLLTTDYTLNIQSNTIVGQRKLLDIALNGNNRGLILYPVGSNLDLGVLYRYYASRFPLVTIDKSIEGIPFPSVVSDNFDGGYQATTHLIGHKHERIAFLSSLRVENSSSIRERYFGYLKALLDAGLADAELSSLTDRFLAHENGGGRDYYVSFIREMKAAGVTAIVAENDLTAIEAMQTVKDLGYSVPEDFSIVGFDNIQMASFVEPALTTVAQNFNRMGYLAAEQLIRLIRNPQQPLPGQTTVPVTLIERRSVRTL